MATAASSEQGSGGGHSWASDRKKPAPCAWCGKDVAPNATGRRRKYCGQSCRQRAYEQRAQLKGTGIDQDSIILRPSMVEGLHDQLFELRCAAEDIVTAVTEGDNPADIKELTDEMLAIARRVENFRVTD